LCGEETHAGRITARLIQAGDEAELYRIAARGEDNRNRTSRGLCNAHGRSAGRSDDRDLAMNEVGRLRRQSLVSAFRPAIADRHVLAVYVAGFLQSLAKRGCVEGIPLWRCAVEESDHRHRRLLRARRERPRGGTAEKRDEVAPVHSITSSARTRSVSGI